MSKLRRPSQAERERKVAKTSRNSHQSPSSDGLKRQAGPPQQAGRRPNGGQPGRAGLKLAWAEHPDRVEVLRSQGQCGCGRALAGQAERVGEGRQPIAVPEPTVEVIDLD